MVALKTERRVFLWRLRPRVSPAEAMDDGKTATLDEVISVLEAEQSAGRARVYLNDVGRILDDDDPNCDPKNQVYIAEIKRDPATKTITLLVNRGDPAVVSPAFINAQTQAVRVEHPKIQESPGWSAHLVISTDLEAGGHRACFEQMPHVSSALVMMALDRMAARALDGNPHYQYEVILKPGGKTKVVRKPYRPTLDAARIPSERLANDLEQGELTGVTLTRVKTFYAGVGVANLVKRQEEKIVLSLRPAEKQTVQSFLGNLISYAKSQDFESVTFQIENLPGKQTNRPTLRLDDQDALEHLYVRAKRLFGFAGVLEQCYGKICSEIDDKMIELLNDKDEWG